jgi:DNA polymerase (family 10)
VDLDAVFTGAKATGTALEINAYPRRLDLNDGAARRAGEAGVMIGLSTDAHSLDQLDNMTFGLGVARRAWLEPSQVLNCMTRDQLTRWIAKKRSRAAR